MGQNVSLEVTVKFVMAGKADIKVRVPAAATVRELKAIIAEKSEIFPEKQLLLYKDSELKDDFARIASYGIVTNCTVTISVPIVTGKATATNLATILYVPVSLPQDTGGLRTTVKTMTTVKSRRVTQEPPPKEIRPPPPPTGAQHTWTPEKHLEIELTRNRMKALMRRKNKTKLLSPTATPSDHGSIISSRIHTPQNEPINFNNTCLLSPTSSKESPTPVTPEEDAEMSDRELKLFFEPMETLNELKRSKRKVMMPPPQNSQELEEIKKRVEMLEKTSCKMCGKKVPTVEQIMRCRCKLLFCRQHRDPKNHLCKIDHKQTGRAKIHKWMPKVGDGGRRKGKIEEE